MVTPSSSSNRSIGTEMASLSALEQLPHALVRTIIMHAPGSLLQIRECSRTLRSRVDEYILHPVAHRFVEEVQLDGRDNQGDEEIRHTKAVRVKIPTGAAHLFRLRLLLRRDVIDLTDSVRCDSDGNGECWYMIDFDTRTDDLSMLLILGECLGEDIESLRLRDCNQSSTLTAVSTLLDGIAFKNLAIENEHLSEDAGAHLLTILREVDRLYLKVRLFAISDPVKLLRNLSSLIVHLQIDQTCFYGIAPSSRYFFGMYDVEWSPIIVEIMSKKLNTLYINNAHYPEYLTDRSAYMLRKSLPLLNKKIWFEASCHSYPGGLDYMVNNYTVKADGSDCQTRYFCIHPSL